MGIRTKAALKTLAALIFIFIIASGATFYFKPLWVNDQIIRAKLWREHVQSKYVAVDGYQIHYLEAGPADGSGTPLVLIHGIGSRGEDWAPMIPALTAQGFHVYVPDLLGYGRSPQPNVDYSISLQAGMIRDFMDDLHIRHADVGGWSMGGWIAIRLALDHPAMVDRLVVFDSAGIYFPPSFDVSLFLPRDRAGLITLTHVLSALNKPPLPAFIAQAAIDNLQHNAWVIQRSWNAMTNGKDLTDFRLHDLKPPTLIVWGSVDRLIPLDVGQRMHEEIPGSRLAVIDGCGHLSPSECPNQVVKATVEFLKAKP